MDTPRRNMFVRMICKIILYVLGVFTCLYAKVPADSSLIEEDPVFANFCFYKDTSTFTPSENGAINHIDSTFILTYYEMERDLSFTINFSSTTSSTSFGVRLPNLDMNKIGTNFLQGMTGSRCIRATSYGRKHRGGTCSGKVEFTPYDHIDFFFSTKDSLYVKSLFDTETQLVWRYILSLGMQKQEVKGENIIYISGFCTEDQLKMIQERKKKK